jgi:predicted phage tail protein
MITTIILHGRLRKLFGREFLLDVDTPAEAIRALCRLKQGFQEFLSTSHTRGVVYQLLAGKESLSKDDLHLQFPGRQYDLYPVPAGSKKSGLFSIILGVVLIAAAFVTGGGSLSFLAAGSHGLAAGIAQGLFWMGASMVIGGIAQLIMSPKLDGASGGSNDRSYLFSGSNQTMQQGGPVPVGYGTLYVGAQVISMGIDSADGGLINSGAGFYTGDYSGAGNFHLAVGVQAVDPSVIVGVDNPHLPIG